jgi:14-3-3 protein
LVEISNEAERNKNIKKCQSLYEDALKVAKEKLKVSDNLRLQLVVNYGSFGDEYLSDEAKIKAKQEVEKTLGEALVEIEKLADEEFVKSAKILSEMDKLAKK